MGEVFVRVDERGEEVGHAVVGCVADGVCEADRAVLDESGEELGVLL